MQFVMYKLDQFFAEIRGNAEEELFAINLFRYWETIGYLVDYDNLTGFLNLKDKDDKTAIHYATKRKKLGLVKILVKNGAEIPPL